jgi:hypothetical protein
LPQQPAPVFLIALVALLGQDNGTPLLKTLLGAAAAVGFSVARVTGKLKNAAQALLTRLHRDAYTDLVGIAITDAPPVPQSAQGTLKTKKAVVARSVQKRRLTPATPN